MKRAVIPLIALFLAGCGGKYVVDRMTEPTLIPVFYTEAGVGRPFTEVGKVVGRAAGPCDSVEGLENAAMEDAQRKAKGRGADAILLPSSISKGGELDPNGYCEFGIRCIGIPLEGKSGAVEITAVAIKYNRPQPTAPATSPVEEKPKTTAPPRVLQPNEPTSSPAETETPSSTEEPEQPAEPEAPAEAPEGDSAP